LVSRFIEDLIPGFVGIEFGNLTGKLGGFGTQIEKSQADK